MSSVPIAQRIARVAARSSSVTPAPASHGVYDRPSSAAAFGIARTILAPDPASAATDTHAMKEISSRPGRREREPVPVLRPHRHHHDLGPFHEIGPSARPDHVARARDTPPADPTG